LSPGAQLQPLQAQSGHQQRSMAGGPFAVSVVMTQHE
jgi:hypothetical protein